MLPRRGRARPGAVRYRNSQTVALASVSRKLVAVRALTFDTYGTVVDWRTSVLAELQSLADRRAPALDCDRFLDEWKAAYRPSMDQVNRGEIPWTTVDAIYRTRLEELLVTYGITLLTTTRSTGWRASGGGYGRGPTRSRAFSV
jgi:hypothetical protein